MQRVHEHFPPGFTPRAEQRALLAALEGALAKRPDDAGPTVLLVEAPPGVGKSHVAMTLARWSGDAYLLTSQKLLQDQYERQFGDALAVVKGRDNYLCERYAMPVPTSRGACRRPRGPACACPYARAKQAALHSPVFCANTAYFLTLRHWHAEHLRRRRLLIVDEAHTLEAQLVAVATVAFSHDEMRTWLGAPLPRLNDADGYRPLLAPLLQQLEEEREAVARHLEALAPPADLFGDTPPSPEEQTLLDRQERLDDAVARLRRFLDDEDREWLVRYPAAPASSLALVPLGVADLGRRLLGESAEIVVLSSAYLGPRAVVAECFGLDADRVGAVGVGSPFPREQRPILYRPVGPLSQATLPRLEPALFAEVAAILAAHPADKGLIHVASHAAARRLVSALEQTDPRAAARLLWIESAEAKPAALDLHRASRRPTVLVSPSLREGVDLPDDFLRFQIVTKMPFPDLGDPWTAARRARDPRWYAVETAKALVQAYGRSCRHAEDHGVTYVLDAHFARFVRQYRPLLPEWFLDAAEPALRAALARDVDG
ncbi:MAG TPA: helicase C-terminal domain-containing protein [Candidatus Tectomicrobia bacterium]|nr:helicase C-terminal domain-containing protein [Candidatus Tectomicrobia bacterium]